MAFVKTYDKWEAAHAFINTWLKDPTLYCNNCGADYFSCCAKPRLVQSGVIVHEETQDLGQLQWRCKNCNSFWTPCCENPQIGTNRDHTAGLIKQNREIRKISRDTAANDSNTMRWGVSLPPRLYHALNKYFNDVLSEPLFDTKEQMREFMKRFKQFCIPERI